MFEGITPRVLKNPEEIYQGTGESGVCCCLRDPSPCPVCGELWGGLPSHWRAIDGNPYHAYFCDEHDVFDLDGTPFEISYKEREFRLVTLHIAHLVDRWRQNLHAEFVTDLHMPEMIAWRRVDEELDALNIINRGTYDV